MTQNPARIPDGTSFPVLTDARLFPVVVVGMGEAPRPREKASPEGEITYSSGCVLMTLTKDGEARANKSASVHVINAAAVYELGRKYVAKGRVYVQPYESNSRVTYSITVEELVPADAPVSSSPEPKG